ncbi:glycosyltransferase family 2 protein [Candidatus Uhrbacteria bacterium]|nr:glycosyltransferase family 2 protein [Candidatus Uhrbacteria bacterium]
MSRVTISLVTYNGAEHLPLFLEGVQKQTFADCQLVVCDNASTDATRELIESHSPSARTIKKETNKGFAQGHNEIMLGTDSEYILVINQDTYLEKDYIALCVDFLDHHPKVASVSGLCVRVHHLRDRDRARKIDSAGISFRYNYFFEERLGNKPLVSIANPQEVFGVSGTAAFYRKSALEKVALVLNGKKEYLDADFFMYKEDVDLAFRLRWAGFTSYVVPAARVYHIRTGKKEAQRSNPFINYVSYRNTVAVWYKNLSAELFLRFIASLLFFEMAKAIYCLIRERSTLCAWRDLMRLRPVLKEKRAMIMSSRKISSSAMVRALHL